jgi:hypothetical protein
MTNKAWEVSTVNMLNALNKTQAVEGVALKDLKYTILDTQNVYRGAEELAELHSINEKKLPKEYVALRPESKVDP